MFPSPSLMWLFLLFNFIFAMLLASCHFYLFRSFSSSAASSFFCLLIFAGPWSSHHFLPSFSLVLWEHQVCLAQSLSTATSSWTGHTVLSWRPLFCCWVNYVVDNTMKSLPTSCSASLEKLSTFEKMKSSTGPNTKARFFQTCSGFFLFLVFPLHLK